MNNIIHGDVDLIKINSIPNNAKKINLETLKHDRGYAIELGEHSGHAHTLETQEENINIYDLEGEMIIEVLEKPVIITHEEHKPLILIPGIYKKTIEQEYDILKKTNTIVLD